MKDLLGRKKLQDIYDAIRMLSLRGSWVAWPVAVHPTVFSINEHLPHPSDPPIVQG
jgi:hypothetical protein